MFDRPYRMRPGDVLIHRAVGSEGNRLIAVGEVLGAPEPSGHPRWPFLVRRRMTDMVRTLRIAPRLDEIGVRPVRVTRRLTDEQGRLAVELIERSAG